MTFPNSDPSTPTFSNSSSSTTPAQDSIVERQNSSRKSFGGREADGLWPSMRSLSSSFNSEYPIRHCKRDGPVRSSSPERMLMKSPITVSEWTKSPIRGRNASSVQSENASPEPNTHQRVINHHRWPAMRGGKVSTMAISGSVDFIDRIGRSASLMLQSRGLSQLGGFLWLMASIKVSINHLSNQLLNLNLL
ncbi:hypothetical protein HPP92_021636 [Vanilla planifolia]|uniref:Uncharacterized protein n=1 Tax=Vanilla planifolia TaxID=51239 RepID=A0A835PZ82_VANPL|nr:hypothetical protein HPP92_021636 [Vanilla planifolia]